MRVASSYSSFFRGLLSCPLFSFLFLLCLSGLQWETLRIGWPGPWRGGVLAGHATRFIVEAPDSEIRNSKLWKKLVKGFREILEEESESLQWIPVHAPSENEELSDDSKEDEYTPVSLQALTRFPTNTDVAKEERLGRILGRRLPGTLNSHFELTEQGGRYLCQKAPWVLGVTISDVTREEGVGPEKPEYWKVGVRYDRGEAGEEPAEEDRFNLPAALPLTPNNLIIKQGVSERVNQPVEGMEATLACLKDNGEVLFITDAEADDDQYMPELQPGPWKVGVHIYSVPDPLAPFGRRYRLAILDNVAITMPPQTTIPLPPMQQPPSLELLLQLELAITQGAAHHEGGEEGRKSEGALGKPPCTLQRGAVFLDPVRLDCRVWHSRPKKNPPSFWKNAMKVVTPLASAGLTAGIRSLKTDTTDYDRMVKVSLEEGKSGTSGRSDRVAGTVLNVKADFGPRALPGSHKAVLERLASQALQGYASSYSENTNNVGPFTFAPAGGEKTNGNAIEVTLDPSKLSARDRSSLGYAPGKTSRAVSFELRGPPGVNVFGRSGDSAHGRDSQAGEEEERKSSRASVDDAESQGMVKRIYHATVVHPKEQARSKFWRTAALTVGTTAVAAGAKVALEWWKVRKDSKTKLKLIQAHRNRQKFIPKFKVKVAGPGDRLLPEAPGDIMH